MRILGIESSCDETAAALLEWDKSQNVRILSSAIHSQIDEHKVYGGVVPEVASRSHMERMDSVIMSVFEESNLSLNDIDAIAVTTGPGLFGGLLVATSFAKSLSIATGKPLLSINHLEGHALTPHLTEELNFPYTLLLVSGGHCQFVQVEELGDYKTIGGTLDDAVGECFDKVAQMLGLPYPGGPNIEKQALKGNPQAYEFPVPLKNGTANFSFSGLKTALRRKIDDIGAENMTDTIRADLCASFQETVAKTLILKSKYALKETNHKQLVLAGGVAANKMLRSRLVELCEKKGISFYAPPLNLCTDNAVMIAYAGGLRYLAGEREPSQFKAIPRWPLDTLTKPSGLI